MEGQEQDVSLHFPSHPSSLSSWEEQESLQQSFVSDALLFFLSQQDVPVFSEELPHAKL